MKHIMQALVPQHIVSNGARGLHTKQASSLANKLRQRGPLDQSPC
jgi:hypothetical protein